MSKLDKMNLNQIMEQTNLCFNISSLYDIWKKNPVATKTVLNPNATLATEELSNQNLALELMENTNEGLAKLTKFLFAHESEIDKVKFVLNVLRNYKEALSQENIFPENRKKFEQGLSACRNLLRDIDETFAYYTRNATTGEVDGFSIIKTKDEARGKQEPRKTKNHKRLKEIEDEENITNIISSLIPLDIENSVAITKDMGEAIRFMVEYNTVFDYIDGDLTIMSEIYDTVGLQQYAAELDRSEYAYRMTTTIQKYIEYIDIDKLLLCSAIRYLEGMELGTIPEENIEEVYKRLQVIQKYTVKNSKIEFPDRKNPEIIYYTKDLEKDMKRFIAREEKMEYWTIEKCKEMRLSVMLGEISLNSLTVQEFDALGLNSKEIEEILENDSNNYIFFLRQDKLPHSKEIILKNIINSNYCSQELLQLLCEKGVATKEQICDMFDKGIIVTSDLEIIKEQYGDIITDQKIFEKYLEYKESKENEEKVNRKTQLERYALAYRNLQLSGKKEQELEARGEKFVETVGEKIEPTDLTHLYKFDIIPLKVAADWGGENIIEELLQNESLKPSDARYLRDNGLLDEKVLERLFKSCKNMSYAYQVALVCTVFDGQTQEEQEIKQKLAQYYHIENGITNYSNKGIGKKRSGYKPLNGEQEEKIKMRDPGAKFNLLVAMDKGVKIEDGIVDGHIIFHYPNIDGGTVLIEKLHKIKSNRESGAIEIKADNESATYVMSEEEFIQLKSRLIQDGKVDRTELTKRWWETRDPKHWIAHSGTRGWEDSLKKRFKIETENSRYSEEDLKQIEELIKKSIESKRGEDR